MSEVTTLDNYILSPPPSLFTEVIMSVNTKQSLLEQLQAEKITIEEYVAKIQIINKEEEEEKQKLKEQLAEATKPNVSKNQSLYDVILHNYIHEGNMIYLVELCNFLCDIVAKELKYVPKNIFADTYGTATVDEVLTAFAALQQKKKKEGDNNIGIFPSKKKMKFTINNITYSSFSDYFVSYITEAMKEESTVDVDEDLF